MWILFLVITLESIAESPTSSGVFHPALLGGGITRTLQAVAFCNTFNIALKLYAFKHEMEGTMGADWDNTASVELQCKCSKKIAGSMTINSVFLKEAWSLSPIHWVNTTKIIRFSSFYWLF